MAAFFGFVFFLSHLLQKLLTVLCVFSTGAEHLDDDVWEIMKPADFFEFAIPFEMPGDTKV